MALDFRGAVPNALYPCIAPEPLDREVVHQPHAAKNLQGGVGHPRQHFTGIEFRTGNFTVGRQALIKPPGRGKGEPIGSINFCNHISDLKTYALVFSDLLTKLLAL